MYFKAFSSFVNVVRLSVLDSSGDSCCSVEAATWLLLFCYFSVFGFLFLFFFFVKSTWQTNASSRICMHLF